MKLGSFQNVTNLTYSYRAGRWVDSVNNILQSFSYSSPATSHNLDDISTFITSEWSSYTSDSNPCSACHNPHAAQGDPLGNGGGSTSSKTSGSRGWPVSLPSLHSKDSTAWGLWGDDDTDERMDDYIALKGGTYQAPYQYSSTNYEPDGSTTTDGSNLADYVTFCTDCHDNTNTNIYSTTLGRPLYYFDWGASSSTSEKHGRGNATDDGTFASVEIDDLIDPYDEGISGTTDYLLSCTDCHEPHGSANRYLLREGVNGGTLATSLTRLSYTTAAEKTEMIDGMKSLCGKCHDTSLTNIKTVHHKAYNDHFPGDNVRCAYCHEPDADDMRNCLLCHYHGTDGTKENSEWPAVAGPPTLPVYDYGEKMF
jgi:hypothetical protein